MEHQNEGKARGGLELGRQVSRQWWQSSAGIRLEGGAIGSADGSAGFGARMRPALVTGAAGGLGCPSDYNAVEVTGLGAEQWRLQRCDRWSLWLWDCE